MTTQTLVSRTIPRAAIQIFHRGISALEVITALGVLILLLGTIAPAQKDQARKELRVLFIGNSLTYYNDLPAIIEALAKADKQPKFEYKMLAEPNFSLEDHWNKKDAVKAIEKGRWDYVVMQHGPSAGLEGRQVLIDYGKRFAEVIRKFGGTPAMYMVWPQASRASDFDKVSETYRLAAEAVNGLFIPAGEAWVLALEKDRSIQLYGEDGFHPSHAGSYLAALVIYERFYDRTTLGLPAKFTLRTGGRIDVPAGQAAMLQRAAMEANARFRNVRAP